jgi:hypothetical protein
VRYKLGRHRVVMAAEIDAQEADPGAGPDGGGGGAQQQQQPGGGQEAKQQQPEAEGADGKKQQQPEDRKEGEKQQQPQPAPRYVELKCYKIPGHPRAEATIYGQKHPRW